jgi:hypothetical protein
MTNKSENTKLSSQPDNNQIHLTKIPLADLEKKLNTSADGLSEKEAKKRPVQYDTM